MAKPKQQKRPGDVVGNAVHIMRLATGQITEAVLPEKNAAAVALGRLGGLKGGKSRAATMTAEERSAAALKAARARWKG